MAKIESRREFSGNSASECFEVCLKHVEDLGYTLFKKRPLANLVICTGKLDEEKIDLSMVVPMAGPTSISVNLSGDQLAEDVLQQEALRILDFLADKLD